jgi:hypothetical protein
LDSYDSIKYIRNNYDSYPGLFYKANLEGFMRVIHLGSS